MQTVDNIVEVLEEDGCVGLQVSRPEDIKPAVLEALLPLATP